MTLLGAPATVKLQLQNGKLSASGHASHHWLRNLQQQAAQYDAISEIDISQCQDDTRHQFEQDIAELEQQKIFFDVALSFNFDANDAFKHVVVLTQGILRQAKILGAAVKIVLRGHSDSVGNFEDNRALSLERADYVAQYLFNTGISPQTILIKGLEAPVPREKSAAERSFNRRVTFEVIRSTENHLDE